jgi:hypothetical protein
MKIETVERILGLDKHGPASGGSSNLSRNDDWELPSELDRRAAGGRTWGGVGPVVRVRYALSIWYHVDGPGKDWVFASARFRRNGQVLARVPAGEKKLGIRGFGGGRER